MYLARKQAPRNRNDAGLAAENSLELKKEEYNKHIFS